MTSDNETIKTEMKINQFFIYSPVVSHRAFLAQHIADVCVFF